jgi:hypothetical protein
MPITNSNEDAIVNVLFAQPKMPDIIRQRVNQPPRSRKEKAKKGRLPN